LPDRKIVNGAPGGFNLQQFYPVNLSGKPSADKFFN